MSDPTSYKALDELLTRNGKKIASRKIANNTYAIRHDGVIAIRFHETEIVRYTSNSMVSLNSGGWLTMATKERINRFTPTAIQVFSQSGRWYVTTRMRLDSVTAPDFESFVPFADGILFDPFASIRGWRTTNHLQPAEVAREDAHNRAIEKLLDKYLRGLDEDTHRLISAHQGRFRIATGELDEDGAKLYRQVVPHENCAMCVRTDVGTLVGDKFEDVQHLIEHLQEKVYP